MKPAQHLRSRTPIHTKFQQVTIIGGNGRMGRFFSQKLSAAGHCVRSIGSNDWAQAEQLLRGSDLVLVSVPIECTVDVIRRTAHYLDSTTALADLTSLKAPIVKAMLEYHPGPVMGLHPMFGPSVESFASQAVVVCPGREETEFQWFLDLMKHQGSHLIVATPEEHDQIMVIVQAIRQFATLGLGTFLAEEQIDIDRKLEFSSPSFRQEMEMITRLLAQSAPLVVDIMLATQERRDAIVRLADTYHRLAQLVLRSDRERLIVEFNGAHNFLISAIASVSPERSDLVDAFKTLSAVCKADPLMSG